MILVPQDALKQLEDLSEGLTKQAKELSELLGKHRKDPDIQELALMVVQLGRITQLQTQALRSIV